MSAPSSQAPQEAVGPAAKLDITVRTATGEGRTPLSAFDRALLAAGVANFNLIPLSSVIPPGSTVEQGGEPVTGGHGDRLYCVQAVARAERPGQTVAAGLGWVVDPTLGGLFVEHTGETPAHVEEQIHASLADLAAHRGVTFGETRTAVVAAECDDRPVCALAIAAYAVADWSAP